MKYKSKETGSEYSKDSAVIQELSAISCFVEKYFEPIYEVGDTVITKGYTEDWDGKPLTIIRFDGSINSPEDCFVFFLHGQAEGYNFSYDMIKRLATPEEIEKATKKFPFEYESLSRIISYKVDDDTKKRDCVWFYENRSGSNGYCLTKSAWQEIGKRKGWL